MANPTVGVIREARTDENRVSLTPESVAKLTADDIHVLVESDAGAGAWFSNDDYRSSNASIGTAEQIYESADIVVCVNAPPETEWPLLGEGQILIGTLDPLQNMPLINQCLDRKATAVSLDMLPRTLSRAQSMDVLSSQANIAGYKAALVAADNFGRYFPMLTTAAGTSSPATVLILGTGVAGLAAIGTARRLGAVVTGYDVRPQARAEIESLGARFLQLSDITDSEGSGGYARQLNASERDAQQDELSNHIGRFDVIITTAKVPAGKPPVLVTQPALQTMKPGSVVVDMAAGPLGGNVAGAQPDSTLRLENGITVIGAANLASAMAPSASLAYSRNMITALRHLLSNTEHGLDTSDEILAAITLTHNGQAVNPTIATTMAAATQSKEVTAHES